jgi:hypothetical protein
MHSRNQRLINLLTSEDPETRNLGIQTLKGTLTEQNAIYWYIQLSKLHVDINDLHVSFAKASLGCTFSSPMENIKYMFEYIQTYKVSSQSLFEFLMLHEAYLIIKALDGEAYLDIQNKLYEYNKYRNTHHSHN